MSWLTHKFAKGMQSGLFIIATSIASGGLIGGATYDNWTEDTDNITGANRDKIVQVFEGQINDLKSIKDSFEQVQADQRLNIIKQIEPDANGIWNQEKQVIAESDALSNHIERELHLVPNISEEDFVDLAEQYNDLFPLGKRHIDIDDAAFLHDAQMKHDMNTFGNARETLLEIVKSDMEDFMKDENNIGAGHNNKTPTIVGISAISSIVMGLLLFIISDSSSSLKNLAREPTPKSPLSKISDGLKKNRQKKVKKTQRLN